MLLITGCAHVGVIKPDGTKVDIWVLGSTEIESFNYERNIEPNNIKIKIGEATNTPEGIPEVIEATGEAVADVMTGNILPD